MTAHEIFERLTGSLKGSTEGRIAKAKALAERSGVTWDDVQALIDAAAVPPPPAAVTPPPEPDKPKRTRKTPTSRAPYKRRTT